MPLEKLENIVFGAWDLFPDSAYEAASKAAVLSPQDLAKAQKFLSGIHPMKAAFNRDYVKRLDGPHVKKAKTKYDLALRNQGRHRALQERIESFARGDDLVRLDGNFPDARTPSTPRRPSLKRP